MFARFNDISTGSPVYVNPDHVTGMRVAAGDRGTAIHTTSGIIAVKQPLEDVVGDLERAYDRVGAG